MSEYILEVRDLTKHFKAGGKQIVHAVDGVSFSLEKGKTLGIVGGVRLRQIQLRQNHYPHV